jgi:hypothetical protein
MIKHNLKNQRRQQFGNKGRVNSDNNLETKGVVIRLVC